jgi:chromosome segregation ATPase
MFHQHFLELKKYDDTVGILNKSDLEKALSGILKEIDVNLIKEKQLNQERIEMESSLKSLKGHLDNRVNAAMYENLHNEVKKITDDLSTNTANINSINKSILMLTTDKDNLEKKLTMYINRYLNYGPLLDSFIEKYNDARSTAAGNTDGGKTTLISYISKKLKSYTGN